jgi:hypothetical protein
MLPLRGEHRQAREPDLFRAGWETAATGACLVVGPATRGPRVRKSLLYGRDPTVLFQYLRSHAGTSACGYSVMRFGM